MHFLRVKVTFYDELNVIHDVNTTPNPYPYTAKFIFVGVTNKSGVNKSGVEREYVYSVAVYQKYLTRLGEMIIFSTRLENYQSPTSLDIFDIVQHYIHIFHICDECSVIRDLVT